MPSPTDPFSRVDCAYHFTDSRNLELIRGRGGIYSAARLRELGIQFVPGGNEWSLTQDRRFGMDRYVHLCWIPGHPMAWHIRRRDPKVVLKYLKIDRSVLKQPGVMFSRGVANAVGVEIVPIESAAKEGMIDFEALYGNIGSLREPGPQARRQAAERSEILVPDFLSLKFIRNFPNG